MRTYSHAVEIAFEVISTTRDGSDITPSMLRSALLNRLNTLEHEELLLESINIFDTFEVE